MSLMMRDYKIFTYIWQRYYRPVIQIAEDEREVLKEWRWSEQHTTRIVAPSRRMADAHFDDHYRLHPAYYDDPEEVAKRPSYQRWVGDGQAHVQILKVSEDKIETVVLTFTE